MHIYNIHLSWNKRLKCEGSFRIAGAHTIGLARCIFFRGHIYNDSNIDVSFASSLRRTCPRSGNDSVLAPLDLQTPTYFDNLYYKNLLNKKGLLHSDQEIFNGNPTDALVKRYAANTSLFFKEFPKSMIKMGNIKPLTGSAGEIRRNCRKANWKTCFHVLARDNKMFLSVCVCWSLHQLQLFKDV